MKYAIIFWLVLTSLISCTNDDSNSGQPLSKQLDMGSFTVKVPANWTSQQDQGIDTYIGRIMNEKDTIYFDFGYLSFGGLDMVEKGNRNISFQRLFIDRVPAVIEREKTSDEEIGRDVRLSIYIDSGDRTKLNRLYTFDPVDEKTILNIYKSHRFK